MYKINFITDYNQFYLVNKTESSEISENDFWDETALTARMAIEANVIGVLVENNISDVKATIELVNAPNDIEDDGSCDHIVEGSLEITSNKIEIQDCPESETKFSIPLENGHYRVRVYSYNLRQAYTDGDWNEPQDHYRIEIWEDVKSERKLIKQFDHPH